MIKSSKNRAFRTTYFYPELLVGYSLDKRGFSAYDRFRQQTRRMKLHEPTLLTVASLLSVLLFGYADAIARFLSTNGRNAAVKLRNTKLLILGASAQQDSKIQTGSSTSSLSGLRSEPSPGFRFAPNQAVIHSARTLGLVILGMLLLVSCSSPDNHTKKITARTLLEEQHRHEAELRCEAFGPSIRPADYIRMKALLASKRERSQQELAMYAKFQMEQKLALADASSPKMLVTGAEVAPTYRQFDGGPSENYRQVSLRHASHRTVSNRMNPVGSPEVARDYPARFYQNQLQENSIAQAQAEYNENAQSAQTNESDAPYAVPVPGRPGFVTMPPKIGGYIDVRGYAPGSYVMDPWTKTIIRVP